ncbi:TerD family protein [Klebsiella aerogenes]|uniref:TerD family protein n=1 Tax=Klebsiella aerogenes TaxID=548 RepID=UPI00255145E5|nr:TerD family protein [Klebsiella aerogenes]EMB4078985.1 TerD family protein [Klebsiella aerogenes]MDK6927878.1 TerD family protein [Klebsiella aerogenes]
MILSPGGNSGVPATNLSIKISAGSHVDVSSFRLYANNKVRGDADMCFYGQPRNDDNTIQFSTHNTDTLFQVALAQLHADVQKVAFSATCDNNRTIRELGHLTIAGEHNGNTLIECSVDIQGRDEAALILGELYRRNGEWKFRFVAQGFTGGLKPLAEYYGVDIADEMPTSVPEVAKVSLSKVTLTKEKPAISLAKCDDYGEVRVNLNWHRQSSAKGLIGSFLGAGSSNVDLDIGAFVELKNGDISVIQALGNAFGRYHQAPFIQLQGDDRTGAVNDGEWIFINGSEWKKIQQILIYAFIYEGVASWDKTDGVVTLHVPGQPPIETRLTEGNNRRKMCAIARLINDNGAIKVERINQYFSGHKEMDRAFGWGFRWQVGSK